MLRVLSYTNDCLLFTTNLISPRKLILNLLKRTWEDPEEQLVVVPAHLSYRSTGIPVPVPVPEPEEKCSSGTGTGRAFLFRFRFRTRNRNQNKNAPPVSEPGQNALPVPEPEPEQKCSSGTGTGTGIPVDL